jgi:SAM-dependent methyltransferase
MSLQRSFPERGLSVGEVVDVDFSEAMLRNNPNPNKIQADVTDTIPVPNGTLDGFECSCPHRVSDISRLVANAARCLTEGGIFWVKVENLSFSPKWADALQTAGFQVISPLNTELRLPVDLLSQLSPKLAAKVEDACRKTRFLFAIKTGEAHPTEVSDFQFLKSLTPNEELERSRQLLKKTLSGATDREYLSWVRELQNVIETVSDESFPEMQQLCVGIFKHAMRLLYANEVRDMVGSSREAAVIPKLIEMLDADLQRLEGQPEDVVSRYLVSLRGMAGILQTRCQ